MSRITPALRLFLLMLASGLLSGCVSKTQPPALYTCTAVEPTCPGGHVCLGGYCVPAVDAAGPPDTLLSPDAARDTRPPIKCGNDKIEQGEECDGTNLGKKTCVDLCYGGGTLACAGCRFAFDQCTPPTGLIRVKAKGVSFHMGSKNDEIGRTPNETRHLVTLTRDFYISPTEVTQEQFEAAMGYNPSWDKVKGHPVEEVTWSEAASFCNVLSDKAGLDRCYDFSQTKCPSNMQTCPSGAAEAVCKKLKCTGMKVSLKYDTTQKTIYDCPGYRLPTEAEWELAYRAGTTGATYAGELTAPGGLDPVASRIGWYYENSLKAGKTTHSLVALKRPNTLCLFDMPGNVYEYVNDFYTFNLSAAHIQDPVGPATGLRTLRGGSHEHLARDMRAARREKATPLNRTNHNTGFRHVRTVTLP